MYQGYNPLYAIMFLAFPTLKKLKIAFFSLQMIDSAKNMEGHQIFLIDLAVFLSENI